MADHEHVAIFWDYENCAPQSGAPGYAIVNNIRQIAHKYGSVKLFKAYLELSELSSSKSMAFRSELQQCGVSLTDCPHNGRKDVADKMMIVDMLAYAIDTPAPATVVLISGDRDFVYAVSVLRLRRYRVVVVAPPTAHISLISQASEVLDWDYEVLEKPRREARPTSNDFSRYSSQRVLEGDSTRVPSTPTTAIFSSPRLRRRELIYTPGASTSKDYSAILPVRTAETQNTTLTEPPTLSSSRESKHTPVPDILNAEYTSTPQVPSAPSTATNALGDKPQSPWSRHKLLSPLGSSAFETTVVSPTARSVATNHGRRESHDGTSGEFAVRSSSITPKGTTIDTLPRTTFLGELRTLPQRSSHSLPSPEKSPDLQVERLARPATADPMLKATEGSPVLMRNAQGPSTFVEEPLAIRQPISEAPLDQILVERHSTGIQTKTPRVPVQNLQSTSSTAGHFPSERHVMTLPTRAEVQRTPLPQIPAPFTLLVAVLDRLRIEGQNRPLRSHVSIALMHRNPRVYEQAGVVKFKQYSEIAQELRLIELGGLQGGAWISLRPQWHGSGLLLDA